jgi:hypothetical protein
VKSCPVTFLSHGCDLAEGHPEELGHVCLEPRYDEFPEQGQWCDIAYAVTFSSICSRIEHGDPRCDT